jgi:hypothetical protein
VKGVHSGREKTGERFTVPLFHTLENVQGFNKFHFPSAWKNF